MRATFILASLLGGTAAHVAPAPSPPCTTPLNPALESICYTTVTTQGNFSIRDYAQGLNVTLVSGTTSTYGGDWQLASSSATSVSYRHKLHFSTPRQPFRLALQITFEYFVGSNSAETKIPQTVPLIYRPSASTLVGSMAIPTSAFPNPIYAPRPTYPSTKLEPFPAIRIAAFTFSTPQIANDNQYSFACGELTEWLGAWAARHLPSRRPVGASVVDVFQGSCVAAHQRVLDRGTRAKRALLPFIDPLPLARCLNQLQVPCRRITQVQ